MPEADLCEISVPNRIGFRFPDVDVPKAELPDGLIREVLPLPELYEVDVVRRYTRLSRLNHSIDTGY